MVVFLLALGLSSRVRADDAPAKPSFGEITRQRQVVAQALQASKDQEHKVELLEKQLDSVEATGQPNATGTTEEAGQAATSDQLKQRLDQQRQLIAQIQDRQKQVEQSQMADFLSAQDQVVATKVDRNQQFKQLQAQIDSQRQNVAQLQQNVQALQATNYNSTSLDSAVTAYQQQVDRLSELETLSNTLAVQAGEADVAQSVNQDQSQYDSKQLAENLQSQYTEAEKVYQQLQTSYQQSLDRDEVNQKKASDLTDQFRIEEEKKIALDTTYAQESAKLSQMATDFSKP